MLVAAISGGAAIPPSKFPVFFISSQKAPRTLLVTGAVATHIGDFHRAMAIPTAFCVLAWVFPVYANFYNKELLDGHCNADLNIAPGNFAHTKGGAVELGQDPDVKRGVDNVEVAAIVAIPEQ